MKTTETFWASLETLLVEQHAREIKKDKRLCLVKILLLKNDNFDLALRKRLFCTVKAAVLRCKTAAFGMQNNRCYNTLITRMLGKIYRVKKYLHILLSADLPDSSSYSTVYLLSISLNSTGKIISFFTAFPSTTAGFHLGISLITRIASRSNRGSTL